jgi:aspartyl-tRNA(Asn)/glutamyl-tRNA(Gln) amidotransferase subunit A
MSPTSPDLLTLGISAAGTFLRDGTVSIPELVAACLERVEQTDQTNAYLDVFADRARSVAVAHQRLLDEGYDLGPLHGIPIALKDNIDLAGTPTTVGSKILRDNVAQEDATVTSRLKSAGAIFSGKTNMHEFAWGGTTNNPHFGACLNPWDLDRIPAGSSGGSGAAVATRSAFAALGTDTGGSVRLPASMNGVTGIRPTIGRISNTGVHPLAWTMDTVGPIAPSALDCALVFQAIAGFDTRDATTRDVPVGSMIAEIHRPLDGLRIALIDDYSLTALQPGVDNAFRAALATFEAAGARVTTVSLPEIAHVVDAQIIVDACEPTAGHMGLLRERPEDYGDDVRTLLQAGLAFTAVDYVQAQRYRSHLRERVLTLFSECDIIATPTIPFTAPRIGEKTVPVDGGFEDTLVGNMKFTAVPSMTGLPAISVPCGFDEAGMPVGMQLMAPAFAEVLLFRVAHQFQIYTDFHRALPALVAGR